MSKDDRPTAVPRGLADRGLRTARLGTILVGAGAKRLLRRSIRDDRRFGEALARELDGMKGMAMKVGQILSYLDVPLPPEAQAALASLQRGASPLSAEAARAVVEQAFAAPLEELFERFDPEPVAAASIGQVHRARFEGTEVAVKLRYPGVAESFDADLSRIDKLAGLVSIATVVDGHAIVEELHARLREECDYLAEARRQEEFARDFEGDPDLRVPRVLSARCAESVLTTEWVDAADFQTFDGRASPAARTRAGLALARFAWRSFFELGRIHGDPHPGNALFDDDGGVTMLDFGCVRAFDAAFVGSWRRVFACVLDGTGGFEEAVRATGMVGREKRFDYAEHRRLIEWLVEPYARPGFRFGDEYLHRGRAFGRPDSANALAMDVPPAWIWFARLHFGLHAVLSRLGAEGDFATPFRLAMTAAPAR